MEKETTREALVRHDDEAISIAIVSTQVCGLKELMLEKIAKQDVMLTNIEKQTTKTNSHVADAFIDIANINAWKNKVTGALLISNIIVVPLLMWLIFHHLHV